MHLLPVFPVAAALVADRLLERLPVYPVSLARFARVSNPRVRMAPDSAEPGSGFGFPPAERGAAGSRETGSTHD
jgi:hypothetical protein